MIGGPPLITEGGHPVNQKSTKELVIDVLRDFISETGSAGYGENRCHMQGGHNRIMLVASHDMNMYSCGKYSGPSESASMIVGDKVILIHLRDVVTSHHQPPSFHRRTPPLLRVNPPHRCPSKPSFTLPFRVQGYDNQTGIRLVQHPHVKATPLHYAGFCGMHNVIRFLIVNYSQDVNARGFNNKGTPC